MPVATRELKNVRPQAGSTVRVLEVLISTPHPVATHVVTHSYKAVSEAQANTDMNARNITEQLMQADFNDLLVFVQFPAQGDPSAFDLTGRDITLIQGENFLFEHFAEGGGSDARLLAWWIKGLNPPDFNTIRDRFGLSVNDGDRIKDRAVALDDSAATFDDVQSIEVVP